MSSFIQIIVRIHPPNENINEIINGQKFQMIKKINSITVIGLLSTLIKIWVSYRKIPIPMPVVKSPIMIVFMALAIILYSK